MCLWERKGERETRLTLINKMSVCVGRENRVLALINTMCVLCWKRRRNTCTHYCVREEIKGLQELLLGVCV